MSVSAMSVPAPLHGLVLSGGRSERMGRDKGALIYPGARLDRRSELHGLLGRFCAEVCVSCRPDQATSLGRGVTALFDLHEGLGPAGGLLSARARAPGAAWLVLACDFPFADEESVARLVRARVADRPGTAYVCRESGMLEPFFAIWEPAGLAALDAERLARGGEPVSPRRVLERTGAARIEPGRADLLANVNTPEELARLAPRP